MPDGELLGRLADVEGDAVRLGDPDAVLVEAVARRVLGVPLGVRASVGVETVTDPVPAPIVGPSAAGLPPEQADTTAMAAAASSANPLRRATRGSTE